MRKDIKFVYFDVGGVALLDFSGVDGWKSLKEYWGICVENESRFNKVWDKYSKRLCVEKGVIEKIEVELLGIPGINKNLSFVKDFVDRFEKNNFILPIFEKLEQNNIPYGLLTDVYPGMLNLIFRQKLIPKANYKAIVDSSVEGVRKNGMEIFKIAQQKVNIPDEQICFVDNSRDKLSWADKLGWKTFLYNATQPKESSLSLINFLKNK